MSLKKKNKRLKKIKIKHRNFKISIVKYKKWNGILYKISNIGVKMNKHSFSVLEFD